MFKKGEQKSYTQNSKAGPWNAAFGFYHCVQFRYNNPPDFMWSNPMESFPPGRWGEILFRPLGTLKFHLPFLDLAKNNKKKTLCPLFMDGVELTQG